ncbi:MAG: hypothetical protein ACYC4L_04025, partial [Chloroflexota bacterium]
RLRPFVEASSPARVAGPSAPVVGKGAGPFAQKIAAEEQGHAVAVTIRSHAHAVLQYIARTDLTWADAMDRRGRGRSGDSPNYVLEREVEDVVAVVDAVGGQ